MKGTAQLGWIVGFQLKLMAVLAGALSVGLLIVASLAPLGLVRPFPEPPVKRTAVPWAQSRPISDPQTLNRRPGEAEHGYFNRLAVSVSAAIQHWWPEADPNASRYTGVTIFSDYAVWAMSKLSRWGHLQSYEFMSPVTALQRGFGFCSQTSRIVFTVLRDNGYQPLIMNHTHHTVVEVNGTVIDADYGVFIPHSLNDLRDKPYLLQFYYVNFPSELPLLHRVYGQPFTPTATEALVAGLTFERSVQYLKWQIPIGLMIVAVAFGALGRMLMSKTTQGNGHSWQANHFAGDGSSGVVVTREQPPPSAPRLAS